MNIDDELKHLAGQIEERTETLCAIYKEPRIKQAVAVVLTLDSIAEVVARVACDYFEDDEETLDEFFGMMQEAFAAVNTQVVTMCDVKDREQLAEDICSVATLRRRLSDRLNSEET